MKCKGWPVLRVRPAIVEDAGAVGRVHVASWQWGYAGLLPAELLDGLSVPERATRWRDILAGENPDEGAVTFVGELPTGLAGFVSVGSGRADVGGPEVGEIRALYVDPGHAGRGVGGALHDAGVEWLTSRHRLARLWVLRGNARARGFYERHGWHADGVEKVEHPGDGFVLDEVRYERDLPPFGDEG